MLVNITLKRLIDFHGHLCPELVIGAKACEYAIAQLFPDGTPAAGVSVIAENSTSALDAIQVLIGATIGNKRLEISDFGKHIYTFSHESRHSALKLTLKKQTYGDEEKYFFQTVPAFDADVVKFTFNRLMRFNNSLWTEVAGIEKRSIH